MAVAPIQTAAGVTESGNFSQSGEDLDSRGLACHSTEMDNLDLDQLHSLFSKVRYNLLSTFPHGHFLSQPYLYLQLSLITMLCIRFLFHQGPATMSTSCFKSDYMMVFCSLQEVGDKSCSVKLFE